MPWSEVCAIVGKRRIALPPIFTNFAVEPLRLLRIVDLPPESLMLLRYGRHIDNDRYKRAGFRYKYTTAGTVEAFARGLRLADTIGEQAPRLPLGARGRELLPPLARRRPRHDRERDGRAEQRDRRASNATIAVAVVTLVDRERRNALSLPMVAAIVAAFDELEPTTRSAPSSSPARRPRSARAPTSRASAASRAPTTQPSGARSSPSTTRSSACCARRCRRSRPSTAPRSAPASTSRSRATSASSGRRARFDSRFLRIGLHPGGGHLWMLERAVGPQAAAACVLFGERDRRVAGDRARAGVVEPRGRRAARRRRRAGGARGRRTPSRSSPAPRPASAPGAVAARLRRRPCDRDRGARPGRSPRASSSRPASPELR